MASKMTKQQKENAKIAELLYRGTMVILFLLCTIVLFKQGAFGKFLFDITDYLMGGIGTYLFYFIIMVVSVTSLFIGHIHIRRRDYVAVFMILLGILILLSLPVDHSIRGTYDYETILGDNGGFLGTRFYMLLSYLFDYVWTIIIDLVVIGIFTLVLGYDYYTNSLTNDSEDESKKQAVRIVSEVLHIEQNNEQNNDGIYPPFYLLDQYEEIKNDATEYIESCGKKIKHVLFENGFNAKVVNIIHGPRTIQYIMRFIGGGSLKEFRELIPLIELELGTNQIRVEIPIANTNKIGIEIPDEGEKIVHIRSLLDENKERNPMLLPLGLNTANQKCFMDLEQTPHLLIVGNDMSGKTNYLHTLMIHLLMNSTPDLLQLVIIDPWAMKFANYEHLPHLNDSIVQDVHDSYDALYRIQLEIERRMSIFNISKVEDYDHYKGNKILPKIIVMISEYVELSYDQDFEKLIVYILQHGKRAGIHLILSTRHASPTVLTNRLRGALPTCICFTLNDANESYLVLQESGAEKLLGKGDLLYKKDGYSPLVRIQAPYVSTEEINRVVNYLLDQHNEIKLYEECMHYVIQTQNASSLALQKHFHLSVKEVEAIKNLLRANGIISNQKPNEPRDVHQQEE